MSDGMNDFIDPGQKIETKLKIRREQYQMAMDLYKHEDMLNWSKLNNLFYVNVGLWAALGFILKGWKFDDNPVLSDPLFVGTLGMISLVGLIISVGFGVALWFGVKYLQNRKKKVMSFEEALREYGAMEIVSLSGGESKGMFSSPTTWVLRLLPILFSIAWAIGLVIAIIWGIVLG